jgi:hypothetical protein
MGEGRQVSTPPNAETAHRDVPPLKVEKQFSLRSLFVTIVTVSMVLAYVRMFGAPGLRLGGFGLLFALVVGVVLGLIGKRLVETLTWSLVGVVLALCCVLSADRIEAFQAYYWLNVGAFTGAVGGVMQPGSFLRRSFGVLFCWLVGVLQLVVLGRVSEGMFDWLLTLPVTIGLQSLIEVVTRLQAKYHTALDMWAAGIVFAVIAGNFGAIVVWNLWYS